ncbi:cysteine proteinase [Xylona heveae TC161]|uniref:Ubiquitin carboxyl-terminal hydrolase n=1 Tax=Xylona heveae (strain CBS 132557 / TC161) TaxID=1328760 RepID=A0A165JBF0_XYLHT|nr:cysteine proteinase [Xylona heveae TC161]KZF26009.1 cysteine proteinase [Xylona heveae TC161]
MSSFFGRFKSSAGGTSPNIGSSPMKRDPNAPQLTPLEKLLVDAGPVRSDGSDKFFGMENFGNTCYCNSILQCLYFSVPFREQVMNYPQISPNRTPDASSEILPQFDTNGTSPINIPNAPTSLARGAPSVGPPSVSSPTTVSFRKPMSAPAGPGGQQPLRPEDVKDSPEYKKKQAMLTGPILAMEHANAATYGMTESLFTSLKDIFEAVRAHSSRIGVVSPQRFLEVLRNQNEMFRSSMHQDAHEFLNLLLNEVVSDVEANAKRVQEETERKAVEAGSPVPDMLESFMTPTISHGLPNPTRWVHELFEGTLTSETKCLTCENVSQRDEPFLDLSVDLEQHSSVTSCLRKFSEEEMLCERNKFHCDNCGGLQEAEKRMKIKRLPRILALHLKRFKYTEDLQRLQKLFHRVVYPFHLRLFNTTDDAEDPDRLYELYAVVVHIGGGPYHGHYISIVKTQDRGWLLFDDEMVEPVDKSYVQNFFGDKPGQACAYVLFYQETTLEAVQREQELEGLAQAQATTQAALTEQLLAGRSNGDLPNGLQHALTTGGAPDPEHEDFARLHHATTAPTESPHAGVIEPKAHPGVDGTPLSPGGLSAALGSSLSPTSQVSASFPPRVGPGVTTAAPVQSKKERAREEKERKAAEKEREKQEKQRIKEEALRRKENEKRQQEDIKAAIAASKLSHKAEEDQRVSRDNAAPAGENKENGAAPAPAPSNLGGMSGSLDRLRHGSRSFRSRSKFWGSGGGSGSGVSSLVRDRDDAKQPVIHEGMPMETDTAPPVTSPLPPSSVGEPPVSVTDFAGSAVPAPAAAAAAAAATAAATDRPTQRAEARTSTTTQPPPLSQPSTPEKPERHRSHRFSLRKRTSNILQ